MADEDFGMSKESMVDEEKFLTKNTMESPIFPRSGPVCRPQLLVLCDT